MSSDYTYYVKTGESVLKLAGTYGYNGRGWLPALLRDSDVIWQQGPKGGVQIIKHVRGDGRGNGYITRDPEQMKEFMWSKLIAKPVNDRGEL